MTTPGSRTAVVVGAGIGGLAAALALVRTGWDVTVLEQAGSLEPVGAGIALAPNAVRALDELGLGARVRSLAALRGQVGLRTPDGRWLVRGDVSGIGPEPTVLVHRGRLVELMVGALGEALGGGHLRLGTRAVVVDAGGPGTAATVRTTGGAADPALRADLVVAADGIDSPTRAALLPGHPGPVYSGVTAWRFVTPGPVPVEPAETWGRGSVVGLTPLADGRVYCYLTAVLPAGTTFADEPAELRRRFGGWHAPLPALLDDLTPDRVLHHDLRWIAQPLPRFDVGRVALLGDAAHAMTPNLGQGGAQAVEDAVVLAAALRHVPAHAVAAVLPAYTAARAERTRRVARLAARVGAATTWRSAPAVALRDAGMRAAGRRALPLVDRRLAWILDWRPPRLSVPRTP